MMSEHTEKLTKLRDIALKHIDCKKDHASVLMECNKRIISKGVDIYGVCFPEMELAKYIHFCGRIVKKEDNKDFAYYYDNKGRLRLTERYVGYKEPQDLIFYYYSKDLIEIAWYNEQLKRLITSGYIEYNEGKLVRFVESGNFMVSIENKKELKEYIEWEFDTPGAFVLYRSYSAESYMKEVYERVNPYRKR
jgi:hypothetical protein